MLPARGLSINLFFKWSFGHISVSSQSAFHLEAILKLQKRGILTAACGRFISQRTARTVSSNWLSRARSLDYQRGAPTISPTTQWCMRNWCEQTEAFRKYGRGRVVTGELDFYINRSLMWGIEILREGNGIIGKHLGRIIVERSTWVCKCGCQQVVCGELQNRSWAPISDEREPRRPLL
jgi:hypothetical protein